MKKDPKKPKPEFVYDPEADKGKKLKDNLNDDFVFDPKHPEKNSKLAESNAKTEVKLPPENKDFSDLKRRKKRWPKVLLIIVILLFLVLAAIAWYIFTHLAKVSSNPFDFSGRLKGEADGRVNIMLLGVGDPGHAGETLADTNMIVSINTKTKPAQVSMLGIPRDTRVQIPGNGYNKINEANALGEQKKPPQGTELSKQTIEKNFDIPIHYYVVANFSGLKQAVDAVGGIDIDVKEPLNDPEYPCEKNEGRSCGFKLKIGVQHMDGTTALKYARCRKGTCGDDFGRAARQQQVLVALREKATSANTLANPAKLNDLINAASNNIKTDLSLKNIQRIGDLTKDLNQNDIISVVLSNKSNGFLQPDKFSSDLLPIGGNFEAIQQFLKNIFTLGPIQKEDITLSILNGTSKTNLGGKLKTKLEEKGVPVVSVTTANAKTKNVTTTTIVDYTGGKKPKMAEYLKNFFGVEVIQPETPVKNPTVDFEITLGSDSVDKVNSSNSNE